MSKIWWLFAQLYKNSIDSFALEVPAVSKFQNRIYIASLEKKIKILFIAKEEMLAVTVDSR